MAISGYRGDEREDDVECLMKFPLEYLNENKEYICGLCGQTLIANHTTADLETHFKSCKTSREDVLPLLFKELRTVNQKLEMMNADVSEIIKKKVDDMKSEVMEETNAKLLDIKTEVGKEMESNRAEFKKEILDLKSEIKKELKTECCEMGDRAVPILFSKVQVLEEGMKEKMAEVNGRVSGVTEAISAVVHSALEAKGKEVTSSVDNIISNELDRSKKAAEALWVQLRKSEGEIQTTKTRLEDEIAQLKTGVETVSEQSKANDRHLQAIKPQLRNEQANTFHVDPSPFDQLAISMNCFNLVTHNYLFQPSFRWTIDDIENITAQKTLKLTSEMFQWSGYPVQAQAMLQLKENDCVYMSLHLKDESEGNDLTPIPQVFYVLRDKYARNPRHKCRSVFYLVHGEFSYSLKFGQCLVHKSWLNDSAYNDDDSIEIEIYVEPSTMSQQVHSYDGILEWTIENYKRKLRMEKDKLVLIQESPYFYTGPNGYRVQVRLFLNGMKGSGLTVRVVFVTGKYDAQLPEFFSHSTTVILMKRKDPEGNISKSTVRDINEEAEYDLEMCKV